MDVSELGELTVLPLNPQVPLQISALQFSSNYDLLWTGTANGLLYGLESPQGGRYASWKAHAQGIRDVQPLPHLSGGGILSVSPDKIACHANGGMSRFVIQDSQGDINCCILDTFGSANKAHVGHMSGRISTLDVTRGHVISKEGPVAEGLQKIQVDDSRGVTALGCSSGQIYLCDPRQGFKIQQILTAHAGGLVDMDLMGGHLATCGWGTRQGQLVPDTIVKVYDVRSPAKVMTTVTFAPGPSFLKFHPRYKDMLYIASTGGLFTAAKTQGSQFFPMQKVDTGGDVLTAMDISSSGECVAFGGSGGYVHTWAFHQEPRITLSSNPLNLPPEPKSLPHLEEDDSFASLLPYYPLEGKLLSDWEPSLVGRKSLPPHWIDPLFVAKGRTIDFVTYVENPYKGLDKAEASRKIAALRNQRFVHEDQARDQEITDKKLANRRASALPYKYRKVHITVDQERKFQEFNFSKYNITRFAGLENGIANCYANALIQVLYFTPQLRAYFLAAVPDASKEFSLLDELALLFRMLASESGHACQATNLLRALRQSREATALGLLEGHAQQGSAGDAEVEANKEKLLSRRIQSLQRFLLDKLHHEMSQELENTTGEPKSKEKRETRIEQVFGMKLEQTMESLQASKARLKKDVSIFQVDLQPASPSSASPDKGQKVSDSAKHLKRSFSEALCASLKCEDETRAWFNDKLQYQHVKRSRLPTHLPQVLAVGTNIHDSSNLHQWTQEQKASGKSWAPFVVALDRLKDGISVSQAQSIEDLPSEPENSTGRTVYHLTATISLVQEQKSDEERHKSSPQEEGHLVAHVRVPMSYLDPRMGTNPTPRAMPPSPGYTPLNRFKSVPQTRQETSALSALNISLPEDPFHSVSTSALDNQEIKADDFGLPEDPFGDIMSPSMHSAISVSCSPDKLPGDAEARKADLSETDDEEGLKSALEISETEESGTEAEDGAISLASPDSMKAAELPAQFSQLKVSARRLSPLPSGQNLNESVWLLINDFAISTVAAEEVLSIFDGHKLPCLLYYTQVTAIEEESSLKTSVEPSPVLSSSDGKDFHSLCCSPPLQNAIFSTARVSKNTFVPLAPVEGPHPGQLLGLDAEFVAFSPPTKAYKKGKEIETAPSRLGLARISVVRGDGPQAGQACIDDYIRATETVTDYLTQYSGLQQGDLDPSISRHHLCTLKTAYLKLRYLVDTGCIFVGHGLKKDFRMINLVVPPSQVIDTVDLFYLKKQRKLSLRFLAAYLLKSNIQRVTHDSIEDAHTALQLYQLYCQLVQKGSIREVIQDMYAFGKKHGWDPTAVEFSP